MTTPFDASAVIRLLDHQVLGPTGRMLGKVDDLSLDEDDRGLRVTGLLLGPPALAPRFPGRLGRWPEAIWRRLHSDPDPGPSVVPMGQVTDIGSAVRVSEEAEAVLLASDDLENWLRRRLVSRIPGAKGADPLPEPPQQLPSWAGAAAEGTRDRHRLGRLMQLPVLDATGTDVGRIIDVHAVTGVSRPEEGDLRLVHVTIGTHALGSTLGYSTPELHRPYVIRRIIELLHRSTYRLDLDDLERIDWDEGCIRLRPGHRERTTPVHHRHPR